MGGGLLTRISCLSNGGAGRLQCLLTQTSAPAGPFLWLSNLVFMTIDVKFDSSSKASSRSHWFPPEDARATASRPAVVCILAGSSCAHRSALLEAVPFECAQRAADTSALAKVSGAGSTVTGRSSTSPPGAARQARYALVFAQGPVHPVPSGCH